MSKGGLEAAALAAATLIIFTGNAHAYLDPGTGSAVTSAILGFFAAIAFAARKYFYKLRRMLFPKSAAKSSTSSEGNREGDS